MSWGIDFKADIYLSRQSYSTKYEVEDKISEMNKIITDCESELKMFASATPKDIVPPDYSEEQINWLSNQIAEILEMNQEYLLERYRLTLYLEYLNDGGEIIKSE